MAFEFLRRLARGRVQPPAGGNGPGGGEDYVSATVITVGGLFSDDYRFRLPWFQRAYAWREEHVGRLLADIRSAMAAESQRYFLGSIRIASGGDQNSASLIDGQQRLVTLTILFAILRDLATEEEVRERADRAIRIDGNSGPAFRIVPQPLLEAFFGQYVQERGGTLIDPEAAGGDLAESERYVLDNRNHLKTQLLQLMPEEASRRQLLDFILDRCHVLVVGVADEDEAWSMLAIEEETGLGFHSSERAKLSLIAVMPREQQEEAGRIWDQCQGLVGADALCKMLRHVRAIKQRRRSSKPIEKDLAQAFSLNQDGIGFLRNELLSRSRHYFQLVNLDVGTGAARERISERLRTLSWQDYQFWLPPVLHWIAVRGAEHEETAGFIENVERLAWMLRLAGSDPTEQERRFIALLSDIDAKTSPDNMRLLTIEKRLLRAAINNLGSRTFYSKHYSGQTLRLLSLRLGRDPGTVNRTSLTIEHILPRNPLRTSSWRRDFSATEIGDCVNRIGNLVLLTFEANQALGTADYEVKRKVLAESRLILAEKAAEENEVWTKDVIQARTDALIDVLLEDWRLKRP
ncbi:MAG: hypothetical protein RLZ98_59 [Pseudomonadota bacterium]|jgi:hypothetical protein